MSGMRALSLCSGIGGLDLAAEWAGVAVVGQVEIDPYCRAVLAKHWPGVRRFSDIREVAGDECGTVDLVFGGIPCQPWSVAGKQRGADDERHLWPEARRVIATGRPDWVCIENVSGFARVALDLVFADLAADGYEAGAVMVPAAAVGAPHLRERVFIVAHATGRGLRRGALIGRERQPRYSGAQNRVGLADTDCAGPQGRGDGRSVGEPRAAQPGVGRGPHGLPRGLDGCPVHPWPAGPHEPQHRWEPPRTTTARVSNRAARLKALGNAVVPQQAYPIFAAIVAAWESDA